MGSVTDFLFNGRPPPTVGTSGSNVTSVPSWLSDYTQGLLARANTIAAEPYQSYSGPRVAGFDPMQQQAQTMAGSNVGNWKPALTEATGAFGRVTGGPGALSQAQPFFNAGTGSYTDQVQKYMDPFVENVIDRSTQLANRNFQEKLMPSINSNFVRAGAYGSAAQQRAVGNAMRDTTQNVQDQAKSYLSDAYRSGADIFGEEASRNLQAGQNAGSLYNQDMSNQMQAGQGLGALGQYIQQLGAGDTASLAAAGADRQGLAQRNLDTAYGDFQAQRDYPKTQATWLQSLLAGIPSMGTTSQTTGQEQAREMGPSGLAQIGSILSGVKGGMELWDDLTKEGGGSSGSGSNYDWSKFPGGFKGGLMQYSRGGNVPMKGGIRSTFNRVPAPVGPKPGPAGVMTGLMGRNAPLQISPVGATPRGYQFPDRRVTRPVRGGLAYAKGGVVKNPEVGALTLIRRIRDGR